MKKLLKSVHIYQSYRQNKPGGPFFGTTGTVWAYSVRVSWRYTMATVVEWSHLS